MKLFQKKEKWLPPLVYINLSFNLTAIEHWIENRVLIAAVDRWSSEDEERSYAITLVPNDQFLFFHEHARQFSNSIGGYTYFGAEKNIAVEWNASGSYFYVTLNLVGEDNRNSVFMAPMDEVLYLIGNKRTSSSNLNSSRNGGILKLEDDQSSDYCQEIHQWGFIPDSLSFRNKLIALSFTVSGPSNLVLYE